MPDRAECLASQFNYHRHCLIAQTISGERSAHQSIRVANQGSACGWCPLAGIKRSQFALDPNIAALAVAN